MGAGKIATVSMRRYGFCLVDRPPPLCAWANLVGPPERDSKGECRAAGAAPPEARPAHRAAIAVYIQEKLLYGGNSREVQESGPVCRTSCRYHSLDSVVDPFTEMTRTIGDIRDKKESTVKAKILMAAKCCS